VALRAVVEAAEEIRDGGDFSRLDARLPLKEWLAEG
jgi:hypothetical protein